MTVHAASSSTPSDRDGTIDIWRANLTLPPGELSRISSCLNSEELQRAARFRFQCDRDRFLASRGLLRHILASYLNRSPRKIHFGYAAQGKPFLPEYPELRFNLSHAADRMIVGVTRGRELGLDVESLFSETVMNEVRDRVLSYPERLVFERLDASQRREWFVRLWTRKEAYIKADGRGMSLPLDHIDVSTRLGRVRLLGQSPGEWSHSPEWTIRAIPVGSGYRASLACEGFGWQLAYCDWPSDSSRTRPSQHADRCQP
jgi:4'-phosphopantetheinyl transferase